MWWLLLTGSAGMALPREVLGLDSEVSRSVLTPEVQRGGVVSRPAASFRGGAPLQGAAHLGGLRSRPSSSRPDLPRAAAGGRRSPGLGCSRRAEEPPLPGLGCLPHATRARGKPTTSRPGTTPRYWLRLGGVLARGEGALAAAGSGARGSPRTGARGEGAEAAGRLGTRGSRSRQSLCASP